MIGFIGLGVMGEPICRNLATKSGERVLGLDLDLGKKYFPVLAKTL